MEQASNRINWGISVEYVRKFLYNYLIGIFIIIPHICKEYNKGIIPYSPVSFDHPIFLKISLRSHSTTNIFFINLSKLLSIHSNIYNKNLNLNKYKVLIYIHPTPPKKIFCS